MDDLALIERWKAEERQPFIGWDFSYLSGRYHEEQPPWSYDTLVREIVQGADSLLDMGTGGGEKLLSFRDVLPRRTIATEGYAPNVPVARANLAPYRISVVEYACEADSRMPFEDNAFSRVINRHEAYDGAEVKRILQLGGVFLTQQVDGRDLDDLLAVFGVASTYLHVNLTNCRQELEAAGLQIDRADEWQGKMTFTDVGALVYFLHAIQWDAPDDFSVERFGEPLLNLYHRHEPLEFTTRRFYLLARKFAE